MKRGCRIFLNATAPEGKYIGRKKPAHSEDAGAKQLSEI
jgi:hypothetical protein